MYQIISDGSCDLSEELIKKHHLEVVPFYVSMDGNKYLKEKVEIDVRDFYQQMVDNSNVYPKTSMPTVDDYYRVFEKYAKDGNVIRAEQCRAVGGNQGSSLQILQRWKVGNL